LNALCRLSDRELPDAEFEREGIDTIVARASVRARSDDERAAAMAVTEIERDGKSGTPEAAG
jgi:hypothetical protein